MIRIREFKSEEDFYRFLKERYEVFYKRAFELREGANTLCLELEESPCFKSWEGILLIRGKGKILICSTLLKIKEYLKVLSKDCPKKVQEILEAVQRFKRDNFKIEYNAKVLPLPYNKTVVMGVLNVTPDSFSDGGEFFKREKAIKRALEMAEEGAEIIDIGGESTRPGSKRISVEEELKRVLPVLREVRKELPKTFISVDTYKSEVARICLEEGADLINDISGGTFDKRMYEVVAQYQCPYVINHIKGRPEIWKSMNITYGDVVGEITSWIEERIKELKERGYEREDRLIIDPGIGFGKLPEHNLEILKRISELRVLGYPILVGVSRKSFVGVVLKLLLNLDTEPKERLYGSLGALTFAVLGGAKIVRVHDVKETKQFLALLDSIRTLKL